MDANASDTVGDVKGRLEQSLPAHSEIRLFQGPGELSDDSRLEVELQAVATKSRSKALSEMSRMVRNRAPAPRIRLLKFNLRVSRWRYTSSSDWVSPSSYVDVIHSING